MTSMMMRYTSTIRIPLLFSFQKRALCKQRSRCGCINWKPGDLASTFTIKQCTARIRTCRVLGEVLPSSVRSSCSRRRNRYSANTHEQPQQASTASGQTGEREVERSPKRRLFRDFGPPCCKELTHPPGTLTSPRHLSRSERLRQW